MAVLAPSAQPIEISSATKILSCRGAPRCSARAGARRPTTPTVASPASDHGRLAGDEERRRAGFEPRRHAERVAELLDGALDTSKKSTSRRRPTSVRAPPRRSRQCRRRASRRCEVKRAPISNRRDVAAAVAPVVRDGVDQARQQRRPQRVELRRQRVGDADQRRRVIPGANARAAIAFDEPERHRLREARRGQHSPDQLIAGNAGIRRRRRRVITREGRLELVEAVMAADFLDQVDLAQQVDAEGRRDDVPAVGRARDVSSPGIARIRSTSASGTAQAEQTARAAARADDSVSGRGAAGSDRRPARSDVRRRSAASARSRAAAPRRAR